VAGATTSQPEGIGTGVVGRLEGAEALDGAVDRYLAIVSPLARDGLRRALSGEVVIGHALHPLLTDLPIGFWTSAFVLDALGGERARPAAQQLIGLGLLCVPLTVLTGASDLGASGDRRAGRVGVVHAAGNTVAAGAYLLSWRARRRGNHRSGVRWALVGGALASAAGHLGGHLAFRLGVGVDRG